MNNNLSEKRYLAASALLLFFVFFYTLIRSQNISISHDEAITYLSHCRTSFKEILDFSGPYPSNNHLLNTLLVKIFVSFFGLSEFVMRIPSLLGHALYLAAAWLILKKIAKNLAFVSGLCLLCLNPYMLDLFSCARGYGLALGFTSMAIYFLVNVIDNIHSRKNISGEIYLMFFFASLAVLSNIPFLNIYLALGALSILYLAGNVISNFIIKKDLRGLAPGYWKVLIAALTAFSFMLVMALLKPIKTLIKTHELYFGGDNGFWADTVKSLVDISLYGKHLAGVNIALIIQLLVAVLILCGFAYLSFRIFKRRQLLLPDKVAGAMVLILSFCGAIAYLQHAVLGTKFIIGRTAIFLVPIFFIFLIALREAAAASNIRFAANIANAVFFAAVVLYTVNFIASANISYYNEWRYDASTKKVMTKLAKLNTNRDLPVAAKSIGINWLFEPAVNFYRVKYRLAWLAPALRGGLLTAKYDYYYMFYPDSSYAQEYGFGYNADLISHLPLEVLGSYPLSESFLAEAQRQK